MNMFVHEVHNFRRLFIKLSFSTDSVQLHSYRCVLPPNPFSLYRFDSTYNNVDQILNEHTNVHHFTWFLPQHLVLTYNFSPSFHLIPYNFTAPVKSICFIICFTLDNFQTFLAPHVEELSLRPCSSSVYSLPFKPKVIYGDRHNGFC